jgi:hypothetical protein
MAAAPRSLCRYVPWTALIDALDLRADPSLPARLDCPLCGGQAQLHVYEDTTKGGAWHHCFDCQSDGDLIELASRYWGVDYPTTVERLAEAGVPIPPELVDPDRAETHKRRHHDRVRDVRLFWQACQEYLVRQQRSASLNALRDRFRLHADVPAERWRAGPGKVFGGTTRAAAERLFAPWAAGNGRPPGSDGTRRLFTGTGWQDVLVVPYYDVPGRVSALFVVGRDGRQRDSTYRPTPIGYSAAEREFGLAGVAAAMDAAGDVLAVDDPMLMCRLYCRHVGLSARPLPVVAWYDGARGVSRSAWKMFAGRRVIFWEWRTSAAAHKTWLQAMRIDGDVCVLGPDEQRPDLDHYLRLRSVADHFAVFRKHARPWPDALSLLVDGRGDGWTESTFAALRRAGVDVEEVARRLRPAARARVLRACRLRRHAPPGARVGRYHVSEQPGGWWARLDSDDGRPVQITNFRIHVDAVTQAGSYSGRLVVGDKEAPFFFAQRPPNAHLVDRLRHHAHLYRLGVLFVRDRWGKRLFEVAEALHPPQYVEDGA